MCDMVGVGVRVFPRLCGCACVDGGGVMLLIAFSTLVVCTVLIAATLDGCGREACAGAGVDGSEISGIWIRLLSESCDGWESILKSAAAERALGGICSSRFVVLTVMAIRAIRAG